jgi:hypothetical protein
MSKEMKSNLELINQNHDELMSQKIKNLITKIYLYEEKIERLFVEANASSEAFNQKLIRRVVWTEELFLKSADILKETYKDIPNINIKILTNLIDSSLHGNQFVLQTIPRLIELFISIYIKSTSSNNFSEFKQALKLMEEWAKDIEEKKLRPHIQFILSYLLLLHKDVEDNEFLFG